MQYELTLTLTPRMYKLSAVDQFRITKPAVCHALRGFEVSLVAELTESNNIHYHGIVVLRDFVHRDSLYNRLRRVDSLGHRRSCTQLINYPKWVGYINQDKDKTRQIIGDPVVLDALSVLCDPQHRFTGLGSDGLIEVPK